MSPARIAWWIWLVRASFIACFLVGFVYLPLKPPETPGINRNFRNNRMASIAPGSPADVAGLKQDDVVVKLPTMGE